MAQLFRYLGRAGAQGGGDGALRVGIEKAGGAKAGQRHHEAPGMIEDGYGQCVDSGQRVAQGLGDAGMADLLGQPADVFGGFHRLADARQHVFVAVFALDVMLRHAGGSQATKTRPVAVCSMDMTVPLRMLTCTGYRASRMWIIVGP